jgi:hypothetical protein
LRRSSRRRRHGRRRCPNQVGFVILNPDRGVTADQSTQRDLLATRNAIKRLHGENFAESFGI